MIGAAHAGWRGALTGVIEATVAAMEKLGADRARIAAALGPMIRQPNYEVGQELVDRFIAADADNARFFAASRDAGHAMFDLAGYIAARVQRAGIADVEDLGLCTYAEPDQFYTYRRTTHRAEPDYGRHINAIALAGLDRCPRRTVTALPTSAGLRRRLRLRSAPPGGTAKTKNKAAQGCHGVGLGPSRLARRGLSCVASGMVLAAAGASRSPAAPSTASRACRPRSRAAPPSRSNRSTARRPALFQQAGAEAQRRGADAPARRGVARSPSTYRVRGYVAAKVVKRQDHVRLGLGRLRRRQAPRVAHQPAKSPPRAASATPGRPPTMRCCAAWPAPAWSSSRPS